MAARVRHIIGCMTGTSLDGLDAALVRVEGEGLAMRASFVRLRSQPMPDDLRQTLRLLASARPHAAKDFVRAARALGELHEAVIGELLGGETIDFVVAHGQTIYHAGDAHLSWQLFDPWPIVRGHKLTVCCDLRQADLAAGGQGAPIMPLADWVMYRRDADVIVNLGGIMNLTHLEEELSQVSGGDIGPCNLLLDGLCRRLCKQPFDRDGAIAASGTDFAEAMVWIGDEVEQAGGSRTLGREQFDSNWLDYLAAMLTNRGVAPAGALRAAVELVANLIAAHTTIGRDDQPIVLAGGGTRNATLVEAIRRRHREPVRLSDELGIPCEAREAMGFAVLGALSQDGVAITLPRVTGAERPGIAGCWAYP